MRIEGAIRVGGVGEGGTELTIDCAESFGAPGLAVRDEALQGCAQQSGSPLPAFPEDGPAELCNRVR